MKMKKQNFIKLLSLFLVTSAAFAQVQKAQTLQVGNTSTNAQSASAALQIDSTTKGLLPPRMTQAQRNAIAIPATGLMVWCTNCGTAGELQVYNGTTWANIGATTTYVPSAPLNPVATPQNAQASVAFTAPLTDGGATIAGYTVTSSPGGFTSTGASSPRVVTGLSNGTSYTFTVVATNAAGNSSASVASSAVTPFTVPGAPTSPVATAGNAQVSVAFTAPVSNGGSVITSYTATSSPGGFTSTGASSPLVVTSLANGTSYTFTVVATNAAGNSSASVASAAVIPTLVCSANVGGTTKIFMCYNLGVTGTQDPFTYQGGNNNGALYQWGRQTDGHEVRTSLTQAGPVAAPVANRFITNGTAPNDWINPQNNSLWLDGSKTANDPCPAGFRVPTQAQWGGLFRDGVTAGEPGTATRNTWTWTGNGYTVGANLYLPAAGYRFQNDGIVNSVGTSGRYMSSTVSPSVPTYVRYMAFFSFVIYPGDNTPRSGGYSVRCISE